MYIPLALAMIIADVTFTIIWISSGGATAIAATLAWPKQGSSAV